MDSSRNSKSWLGIKRSHRRPNVLNAPSMAILRPVQADITTLTVDAVVNAAIPGREICIVIAVNARLRVTGHSLVSIGTLNETKFHPRELFRAAVALNAFGIILMHNHPSGDPAPRVMTT